MTWLEVDPAPHKCAMPSPPPSDYTIYGVGSKWRCDDCYAVWEITSWVTPMSWDSLHPTWKQLS